MAGRLLAWAHAWAVALDQLAYVTLAGPAYLIGRGPRPSPYETISSCVGRNAAAGRWWAMRLAPIIDHLFELLGSPPGHCRRSVVRSAWLTAALP